MDQLLGINNAGLAVGFYTDGAGNNHGYTFNAKTGTYAAVSFPSSVSGSVTSTAINNHNDVAGFYTDAAGSTDGFLLGASGSLTTLKYPGAAATQAFGLNDSDEVVGVYSDGAGTNTTMHGFTWTPKGGFASVDDPHGVGTTTINGVNDAGDVVGFYADANGNTDGFSATPLTSKITVNFGLTPMPQGQLVISAGKVSLGEYGFTPGSSHEVALSFLGLQVPLATVTASATGSVSWSFSPSTFQKALHRAGEHSDSTTPSVQLVILNAGQGTPVIAQTPAISGFGKYPVHAVEPGWGTIKPGLASISYTPATQTLSVTVDAFGLTPGAHAAHIHAGSCQQQGGVVYMLMDFIADSHGNINHEIRTVTGVSSVEMSGGWYLNLHQGNSNNIVSNGVPTINFRPLLCANF